MHTTNRDHAAAMVAALDAIVAAQGPFYGIMGYSQGSAAVPVYLSQVATGTFQTAIMFCGYIPTTHDGLVARITETTPFGDVRSLVWMSNQDSIITNAMRCRRPRSQPRPLSQTLPVVMPCQPTPW